MIQRKTLRFQINISIILTFGFIAVIFGSILFSLEAQRHEIVIEKVKLSLNAIIKQREEEIANEIFLKHQEAVGIIIQKMLEVEDILAINVYDAHGKIMATTSKPGSAGTPVAQLISQ